jgi:hypothetical protein
MKLHQDFKEFIELLNGNNVEYLLIGGYAVVLHGYVRSTGDIDLWINNSPENANKVIKALTEFGFSSLNLSVHDFIQNDQVIQLGYPPYRIDIITSIEGLNFTYCFNNKVIFQMDENYSINLIDIESLKKSKSISGRHRDLEDLENL